MKVIALGGSAAGPNTGAGCAGFLIMHENTSLVLDLGPGTLLELRKHVDFRSITAIVISHYHLDHVLDLGALRYSLAYNPIPAVRKPELHVPPGGLERFQLWAQTFGHDDDPAFFSRYFDFSEYLPTSELTFPGLRVAFAPTIHPTQGWAMRVTSSDGGVVGYTADTGPAADLGSFFRDVDLLISECTEVSAPHPDSPQRGHLTAFEAGRLANEACTSTLMLTHMWEENGTERAVADAASCFPGQILVARPGLAIYT